MPKAVEFQLKIKNVDSGVLQNLTVEATGLDDMLVRVGKTAHNTGSKLKKMAELSMVFHGAVRSVEILRDMVSSMAAPYNSFETAMRSANTMAGKSGDDFDALSEKIVGLSKNIPLAREELAGGLYQVISNGVPEDNWIAFLEQSSKAAVGGIADLGQTVTVTSTLIKNYGLSWDQAGVIQDKIQMTAKNGVTSFEQLGQALPRVSGSASQLGVSMDELMAVFATATGVTGNTAEVSTQLAAVLNALVKPSSEATKAAEAMGIGFNASSVQAAGGLENFLLGLDASIREYAAKTGQLSQTIYGQLFGSAEALRLLGSLTGEQKEKFTENIGAMADSAGTIDDAFNEMSSTGENANRMLKNHIQSMLDWAGAIAGTSAPYVEMTANAGLAMMSMVQLGGGLKTMIAGLKGVRIATLAHAAASKVAMMASSSWKVTQTALNFVLGANPIGIVIRAIAGLVVILVAAYKNCESFRDICDRVWTVVKDVASVIWNYLIKAFEKASAVIRQAWEWVKKFFGIKNEDSARQTADIEKNTEAVQANTEAKVANAQKALKGNRSKNAPVTEDQSEGKYLIANAKSYKDLANNIQYYKNKLESTKGTETETITLYTRKIARLQEQQNAITRLQDAASRPSKLNTLEDIDKEITYQQGLRQRAAQSDIAGIDKEIRRLNNLKTAFEDSSHVAISTDWIKTYEQLDDEIAFYEKTLQTATLAQRTEIQKQILALQKLRTEWDDMQSLIDKPADMTSLNSMEALDKAISYYSNLQRKVSGGEIENIQRAIDALSAKREALKRMTELPAMQRETADLDGLSGRKLRIELELVGLDGIRGKIRSLQKMLADTDNPLGVTQRKEVENLMRTWTNYEHVLDSSGGKLRSSTDAVNQLGGSLSSLGDAIDMPEVNIAGTMAQAIATMVQGYATATSMSATMGPWAWIAFAATGLAQLTAMISSVKSVGKYADGGIAYGPTLGIFGEYAGASHNPEVVAPLDRLKSLIGGTGGALSGRLTGRIKGRDIVIALANETRINRKKTNIKL